MRVMRVPTCPTFIAVAVVEASVVSPITPRVLCNERAPAPVVVAFPFIHNGPAMVAELVVEALVNVLTPVTPSVEGRVEAPVRPSVLCNERAPAPVVVAFPFIHNGPAMVAELVVEALVNVLTPVTLSVVDKVPDVQLNAPLSVKAPAGGVGAFPPPPKAPPLVAALVVEALVNVLTPVTESVPAVSMFVLMVVAA